MLDVTLSRAIRPSGNGRTRGNDREQDSEFSANIDYGFLLHDVSPLSDVNSFVRDSGTSGASNPGAADGFVLYPSRPNLNMVQSVYRR